MEIYFINICIEWLYRLYIEYITNLIIFIDKKFNIQTKTILINEDDDYINIFKNNYKKKNKYIFLGNIYCINEIYEKYKDNNFYYLNIEQMSIPSYYDVVKRLNSNLKIVDYSEENIPFLDNNFKLTLLLPPIFPNEKKLLNEKNINIISFSNNDYRKNYLSNVNQKFNIKLIDNIFGEERDNLFRNSKIYLNIHSSDKHQTMELIRIINLLKKQVIVISQDSIDINCIHVNNSILTFKNIEQLEYLLEDVLNNYESYYDHIFFKSNLTYYDNYVCQNIKNFINN